MKRSLLICMISFCVTGWALADNLINVADSLYNHRGNSFNPETQLADSAIIDSVISLYKISIEEPAGKSKEEAIWKLLRAYYYKGNFTTNEKDLKKEIFDKGKNLGVESLNEYPESAEINFWTAVLYGVWAEEYGKLKAAREGAAGKIRDYCEKVIELDSMFADAGGYRILGRVHFKSPKIPLILGWPSKEKAVEYLERAVALAPDNLFGKQYLAEALYERDQKQRAISLMQEIVVSDNTELGVAETAQVKREAAVKLSEWLKDK